MTMVLEILAATGNNDAKVVVPAKPYQSGSHELANAVSIQFSAADSAFCLVAIVQYDMQLKRSTYEIIQFHCIPFMDKTPLSKLFDKTYSNDAKEQLCPLIPGLID